MGDPWLDFLNARARCIVWMASEGRDDATIAGVFHMDAEQVRLIREFRQAADLAERDLA